jgi:IstB-like ATP binding protein
VHTVIKQQCDVLHLPTIASQCTPLGELAESERQPYFGYLEALLAAELVDRGQRAIERRIKDAHLPRVKTLGRVRLPPGAVGLADPGERPG